MELNSLRLSGKSLLTGWKPGVIENYLKQGYSLRHAQVLAFQKQALLCQNEVNNLVVLAGKQLIANLMIDAEAIGLTYHAIGTNPTPPTAYDVGLGLETSRRVWTSRSILGATANLSVFYTASVSSFHIQECGVFGGAAAGLAAGSGIMFSHYLQEHDNSAGLMDLTFDYQVSIT